MKDTHRSCVPGAILLICVCVASLPAAAFAQGDGSLTDLSDDLRKLVISVSPSVVQIYTTAYGPDDRGVLTASGSLATRHTGGSGVILDPDGYIVTNAHVVKGARRVQVLISTAPDSTRRSILEPRGRLVGAQVIRVDEETDLAVLKVQETGLPFLRLGDSDDLEPGQLVLAFGNPLGLKTSVSLGAVSAKARQLRPEHPMIYIQTDAAINPGNSGGPLVDTQGRVVGINTFIFSRSGGSEGLGFAAPSNIVRSIFEQVRDTGRIRRGIIGARPQTITRVMAEGLGLKRDWGVILSDVDAGGPAADAGLSVGDVVLTLDGKVIENGRQFTVNVYRKTIGKPVEIRILRGEEIHDFQVLVAERRDESRRFLDFVDPEVNLVAKLGLLCLQIDQQIAALMPRPRKRAAVLVAARAPGDLLYELNGLPILSLVGLKARVSALETGKPVVFQVERSGDLVYVAFRL
jgi:serine protease Do